MRHPQTAQQASSRLVQRSNLSEGGRVSIIPRLRLLPDVDEREARNPFSGPRADLGLAQIDVVRSITDRGRQEEICTSVESVVADLSDHVDVADEEVAQAAPLNPSNDD